MSAGSGAQLPSGKKKEAREREDAFERAFAEALAAAVEKDPRYEGDLAFLLGLEAPSFSRYKNGRVTPSLGKAMLLAAELGFSLDALLRPAGQQTAPSADLSPMARGPLIQERRQSARGRR